MEKHPLNIKTATATQHALVICKPLPPGVKSRRLVLLHGAGVAGEITWMYLANYLQGWDEILIPDFAGMGKSRFNDITAPAITDYSTQIQELMTAVNWDQVDIAGYSFGGMVLHELHESGARIGNAYLMEPAMLFSEDTADVLAKADDYRKVAEQLSSNPDDNQAYVKFLNAVSPARINNEQTDKLTVSRLKANAAGFTQSLTAVSDELTKRAEYFSQWNCPWPGMSFIGGLSPDHMRRRHEKLENESPDWQFEIIPSADHSLVFTKPRTIAAFMNAHVIKYS